MALPNTDLSVEMIREELEASTNDVGQLCIHPNVNMWSKRKPVRFNTPGPLTQANLEAVNYGLGWKSYANIGAIKTAYESSEQPVFHNKPRGGTYNEPYRLEDFSGYEHSAIQPIAGAGATQQVQNIENGQTKIVGNLVLNGYPKDGEISWEDLGMGNRKLAIALYDRLELVKVAVADNPGDAFVEMDTRYPLPVLDVGTYNAYLFFTNNTGTTSSSLRGIPNHSRFGYHVQVVGNTVLISVAARWNKLNPNQIIYTVEGTNQTGSPVTLLNCSIRIRSSQNDCTSTIQQGERLFNLDTLTLPNTGAGIPAIIYSDTVTVSREVFPSWKMCWNNGGAYPFTTEANIIQEM